jgi:hypothetical protein
MLYRRGARVIASRHRFHRWRPDQIRCRRRDEAWHSCPVHPRAAMRTQLRHSPSGQNAEFDHLDGGGRPNGHAFSQKPNSVLSSDIGALPAARRQINFSGSQKVSEAADRLQYCTRSRTPRRWRRSRRSPKQRTVRCVGACERTRGLRSRRQWITVRWLVSQLRQLTRKRVSSKE